MAEENEIIKWLMMGSVDFKRVNELSGIYLLKNSGEVVYVGQTKNIFQRIQAHINDPEKVFDSFTYCRIAEEDLNSAELEFIRQFNPVYNKVIPPNDMYLTEFRSRLKLKTLGISEDKLTGLPKEYICSRYYYFKIDIDRIINGE